MVFQELNKGVKYQLIHRQGIPSRFTYSVTVNEQTFCAADNSMRMAKHVLAEKAMRALGQWDVSLDYGYSFNENKTSIDVYLILFNLIDSNAISGYQNDERNGIASS